MARDARLRQQVNPLLIDNDGIGANPHPDGRAWLKSCGECAFRTSDPQELGETYQGRLRRPETLGGEPAFFYCIHREDDGCNRICAAFAAFNRL